MANPQQNVWSLKRLKLYYSAMRALLIGVLATGGSAHAQQSSIELSPEDAMWLDAKADDTPQAYQDYLQFYPVGRFAGQAFRRLIEQTKFDGVGATGNPPEPAAGQGAGGLLAAADLY